MIERNIIARNAEVGGKVQGTIQIAGLLTLKLTAVVSGGIITNKLVFEKRANFNSKCNMGEGSLPAANLVQPSSAVHKKQNGSFLQPMLQQASLPQKGANT